MVLAPHRLLLASTLASALIACSEDPGGDDAVADSSSTDSTSSSSDSDSDSTEDTTESSTDSTEDTTESSTDAGPDCPLETIILPGDTFHPDAVAAAADGTIYIGSRADGTVVQTLPCETDVTTLIPAGELAHVGGLLVDDGRDLLIACDADLQQPTSPSIAVFTRTGELVATHPFEETGTCDDLARDPQGNVYASDGANGRILRLPIAALTVDGSAVPTWLSDPAFTAEPPLRGINGLAHDGQSTLYAVHTQLGALHAVTIADDGQPAGLTLIQLDSPMVYPDDLEWVATDRLLVIESGIGFLTQISLNGNEGVHWGLVGGLDEPSALALDADGIRAWIAEGQLSHLGGQDPAPPSLPFRVVRALF